MKWNLSSIQCIAVTSASWVKSNEINLYLKDTLWNFLYIYNENHSDILKLCRELDIMIKKSVTMECCVINGAGARVIDWKCRSLDDAEEMHFAMTDYSSWDRTQISNVISLSNCRNYWYICICLFRGSIYEETAIIQRFDDFKYIRLAKAGISSIGAIKWDYKTAVP